MNTHVTRRILGAFLALMLFSSAQSAHAGLFRAYLSVDGNDANPCTVAAPCRLLPAALAAVNDGGEVWMLDSANFNTGMVTIAKSVTILAVPGAVGSVVANGTHAIYIFAAGAKVTLRNLNVLNLGGSSNNGVWMSQGAELTLENCEVYGMSNGIIVTAANSVVAIKDTVIRDTTSGGVNLGGTVKGTLDGVLLLNNYGGLQVQNGASAAVGNSVFANNSFAGISVNTTGASTGQLVLVDSVVNGNGVGIAGATNSAGDAVSITLQRNAITGNVYGVAASAVTSGSTLTVVLDANALIANSTAAIVYSSPAIIHSRGNNTAKLNGTDVSGPALTAMPGL